MWIAMLFTIAKKKKVETNLTSNQWINETWNTHTQWSKVANTDIYAK